MSNDLTNWLKIPQCCNHIINSKASVNKRKDAQKLATYALTEIQAKSALGDEKTKNEKYIGALENAFGNLDLKSN